MRSQLVHISYVSDHHAELCIQCAEIVCGYVLRIFLLVYPIELFNDGRRVLDDPETIDVLIKIAF